MKTTTLRAGLLLVAAACAAFTASARTVTLTPDADTFIRCDNNQHNTNFGRESYLSAGAARESLIRFDLSGVSQVTSAKIRLYVTQLTGDGKTDVKPVIFRKMRDLDWGEGTATRNNMVHEVPFTTRQSAWIAPNDALFAGATCASAVNEWIEADVTEAVAASAEEDGRISLHVYSPAQDRCLESGSETPLCFESREAGNGHAPQLVIECDGEGGTAPGGLVRELVPTDDATLESNIRRSDCLLANPGVRSFLMKFNIGSYDARQIESAYLELRGTGASNATSTKWDLLVEDAGDWSEGTIQNNALPPNVLPYSTQLQTAVPANGLRFTSWNATSNYVNRLDVTALVKQAASFTSGFLTFQGLSGNNYVIAACKDFGGGTLAPKLIVRMHPSLVSVSRDDVGVKIAWPADAEATAYSVERALSPTGTYARIVTNTTRTAVYDATYPGKSAWWYRIVTAKDESETAGTPVRFYEKPTESYRYATQYAEVFFNNGGKSASHASERMQIGNPQNYRVLYDFFDFDTTGLENAPVIHLRLYGYGNNGNTWQDDTAAILLMGSATGSWDATKVTWDNYVDGFSSMMTRTADGNTSHPCSYVKGGTVDANLIGYMQYDVHGAKTSDYYFDFDVTAFVRDAARRGLRVTFALSGVHFEHWRYFASTANATQGYRPRLVYPEIEGFNAVTATDDLSGEKPVVNLSWESAAAGATYTVSRTISKYDQTKILATDITATAFSDAKADPAASVYTVTAALPDGEVLSRTVAHTVDAATKIACAADTFVHGGSRNSSYGTQSSLVMKYESVGSATREALMRFDLSGVPANAKQVTLTIMSRGDESFDGDEKIYLRTMDDILIGGEPWSNANAPSWNVVFPGRGQKPSTVTSEGCFAVIDSFPGSGVPMTVDVTAQVALARAAGKTTLTVHAYMYDPDGTANFGIYAIESPMDRAAYLSCVPANWNPRGMLFIVR